MVDRNEALDREMQEFLAVHTDVLFDFLALLLKRTGMVYARRWGGLRVPYYDHRLDWALGPEWWMWYERGVFGYRYMREGDKVLDLCCGDGFYTGAVFGDRAGEVHGVDRNEVAIEHARKHYGRENVTFFAQDALEDPFPSEDYDFVTIFGSIEHFHERVGRRLLRKIAKCLEKAENGLFLGSTPILDKRWAGRLNFEHGSEFFTIAGLFVFLWPSFRILDLWESRWGLDRQRRELYFLAKPRRRLPDQERLLYRISQLPLDIPAKQNDRWVALEAAHFSGQWFFDENGKNPVFLHWRADQ